MVLTAWRESILVPSWALGAPPHHSSVAPATTIAAWWGRRKRKHLGGVPQSRVGPEHIAYDRGIDPSTTHACAVLRRVHRANPNACRD